MNEPVLSERQKALQAKALATKTFQDLFIRASQNGFHSVYANHRRGKRYDLWREITTKMEKADVTLLLCRDETGVTMSISWGFHRTASGIAVPVARKIFVDKVISVEPFKMTSIGMPLKEALEIIDAFSSPDMATALMGMPIFDDYIDFRLRRAGCS